MFKILMATDGSSYALRAADYLAELCLRIADAEVTVLYVIDLGAASAAAVTPTGMPFTSAVLVPSELEKIATVALEATRQRLLSGGRAIATRTERGKPADVICKMAEQEKFDLVVMGSSGMGRITGILLGSVSDRVVHNCNIPALVVRHREEK